MEKIVSWVNKRVKGEDVPLDVPAQQQDLGGIYLEEAIVFHLNWRTRWLDSLSKGQNLNPDEVCLDHICEVGQWLYGEDGLRHSDLSEYSEFKELHAQFHKCAADIVVAHKKGYFAEAFSLAKNDLVSLSEQVGMTMVQLLHAIQTRAS